MHQVKVFDSESVFNHWLNANDGEIEIVDIKFQSYGSLNGFNSNRTYFMIHFKRRV